MCVCVCLRVNFIILEVREEAARQAVCRAVGLGGEAGVPSTLPTLPLPLLCHPSVLSSELLPLRHFPALSASIWLLQSLRCPGWGLELLVKASSVWSWNARELFCASVFSSL